MHGGRGLPTDETLTFHLVAPPSLAIMRSRVLYMPASASAEDGNPLRHCAKRCTFIKSSVTGCHSHLHGACRPPRRRRMAALAFICLAVQVRCPVHPSCSWPIVCRKLEYWAQKHKLCLCYDCLHQLGVPGSPAEQSPPSPVHAWLEAHLA